jgi:hypothetical protein
VFPESGTLETLDAVRRNAGKKGVEPEALTHVESSIEASTLPEIAGDEVFQ